MVDLIVKTPAAGMKPYTSGTVTRSEIALGKATSIAPFKGQDEAVATALGLKLPKVGKSTSRAGQELVWFSQSQFLALGFDVPTGVAGLAALTDQSDAWCALELTGEGAEDVLARLVPVDLRAGTFKAGHALRSHLGHMPLHITRLKSGGFRLLSFRSMAGTMVHEIQRAMDHLTGRGRLLANAALNKAITIYWSCLMIPLTRFTILATCGALLGAPLFANSKQAEICETFGEASAQFAEMRVDGFSEMDAQLAFAKGNGKSPLLAMQLVPYVSAYVYGLTKEQLLEDVKTPFVEQCNAANG